MNDSSAPVERPGTGLPQAGAHPLKASLREKAAAIRAEQIRLLYTNAPLAFAGHFINSLFLAFILWDMAPRSALLGWLTYTYLVASVRFVFVRKFWRRSPGPIEVPRWGRLFNVGSALSGLGWGAAAFLIFPEHSIAHQVFLTLVVAGMGAGAVTLVASVKEAFFSFTLPTFLPLILRLLTHPEPIENAMGAVVALFAGYMISTGLRMHDTITTSLSLRFENTDLIDSLQASEERYRHLVEHANDIIYETDVNGHFTFVNPTATRIMKFSEAELIGRRFVELIRPDLARPPSASTDGSSSEEPPTRTMSSSRWRRTGRKSGSGRMCR